MEFANWKPYDNKLNKPYNNKKLNSYAEYNVDSHDEDPKFEVDDHVAISKLITVPSTYIINDLMVKKVLGFFYEKELPTNKKKRKANKPHVKWKGYDNSFNSWFDKKSIV